MRELSDSERMVLGETLWRAMAESIVLGPDNATKWRLLGLLAEALIQRLAVERRRGQSVWHMGGKNGEDVPFYAESRVDRRRAIAVAVSEPRP